MVKAPIRLAVCARSFGVEVNIYAVLYLLLQPSSCYCPEQMSRQTWKFLLTTDYKYLLLRLTIASSIATVPCDVSSAAEAKSKSTPDGSYGLFGFALFSQLLLENSGILSELGYDHFQKFQIHPVISSDIRHCTVWDTDIINYRPQTFRHKSIINTCSS